MKIYLASGFSVQNVAGKELQLLDKYSTWKRLYSYFFLADPKERQIRQSFDDLAGKVN
jgi:hypothetical protein